MESLQDYEDLKRHAECAKRDYEFAELMGADHAEDIAGCDRAIAECSAAIGTILEGIMLEEANRAQWALIVDWANRLRRKPEDVAHLWIRQFSQNFRNLWESWITDHASLLANVYRT